ncbi:MAG: aldo/keto reductase [FCB group bacterium]|nr:aldo/keto reductase [FCB group bacterium]
MKYRLFGNTGKKVSELGFGTWGLSGTSYGPVDDRVSIKALKTAFDQGINFFDTADLYGDGHSEAILGKALGRKRDQIFIATKGGTLPHTGFYMPQDFSIDYLNRALENSLTRLKTDYIDLYQLHSPEVISLDLDNIFTFFEKKVQEGKIRYFGISLRSPVDGMKILTTYHLDAIQVNYNLIDQRAEEIGLFNLCSEKGVAVIVRTPLCFGFLTGQYTGEELFTPPDHRANWPHAQIQRWAQATNLFSPLNENKNRTLPQLALAFCYSNPAVSSVIPGMMNSTEVIENVQTLDLPDLSAGEMDYIQSVYRNNSFFDQTIKQTSITKSVKAKEYRAIIE